MVSYSSKTKTIILLITCIFIVSNGLAQSNWTVEKADSLNQDVISPESPTIQVVNISANATELAPNDPMQLTPDILDPQSNATYNYNKTEGQTKDLSHFNNGFWYAKFEPNTTKGTTILYGANGTTSNSQIYNSTKEANLTETLTRGAYKLELQDSYENHVKAGREFEMDVAVTEYASGNVIDDTEAKVQLYFQNTTDQLPTVNIDNYENGEFYNSRVNYPDNPDSKYIMHVLVYDVDGNLDGTTSRIIDVAPQIQGNILNFSATEGCSTQTTVSRCEQGTSVETEYEITNAEAKNVNLSIYAFNESGRTRIETMNLTQNGNMFTEEITVPDLNTSKYIPEMEFKFNATNNYREHVDRHNVTLEKFKIQDRSPPTTYIGQNYEFQIFLGKPYTLNNYEPERFEEININITDSEGEEVQTFAKEDLTYSSTDGVMRGSLLIDEDNPTGSYDLKVTALNIYGEPNTLNSGFSVRDVNATFEAETSNEFQVNKIEPVRFNIPIENLLETEHQLEYQVTELSDQLTVINDTINLRPEERELAGVEVDLDRLSDETGKIKFIDTSTNYNQTVEVKIDTPKCQIQVGNLCSETSSINVAASTTGTITESITLRQIGAEGNTVDYNTTVEGEIGPHVSVQNQNITSQITGEKDVSLDFQPQARGYFEGEVIFENQNNEELAVPLSLDYDGDEVEQDQGQTSEPPEFSLETQSIDLGTVIDGDSPSETVEITNTGEPDIESISIRSNAYTVSTDTTTIPSEESASITITFQNVDSSSGDIEVTAQSGNRETTETISVTASPIQNYAERTSELRNNLRDIQSDASEEYQADLTEASTKISRVETEWNNGNYEQARSTYQEVSSTLATIDAEISQNQAQSDSGQTQSQGGAPLLPMILIIVIILAIMGFVFYESYIPEEGDPLYSVLGENQQ